MSDVNTVIFTGRLIRAPMFSQESQRFCFTFAVTSVWNAPSGEEKSMVIPVRMFGFGRSAAAFADTAEKGRLYLVFGRLGMSFDANGGQTLSVVFARAEQTAPGHLGYEETMRRLSPGAGKSRAQPRPPERADTPPPW